MSQRVCGCRRRYSVVSTVVDVDVNASVGGGQSGRGFFSLGQLLLKESKCSSVDSFVFLLLQQDCSFAVQFVENCLDACLDSLVALDWAHVFTEPLVSTRVSSVLFFSCSGKCCLVASPHHRLHTRHLVPGGL